MTFQIIYVNEVIHIVRKVKSGNLSIPYTKGIPRHLGLLHLKLLSCSYLSTIKNSCNFQLIFWKCTFWCECSTKGSFPTFTRVTCYWQVWWDDIRKCNDLVWWCCAVCFKIPTEFRSQYSAPLKLVDFAMNGGRGSRMFKQLKHDGMFLVLCAFWIL
jgi:hypothetical protein